MGRTHDPGVIDADIREQLVELDILLSVRADQVMKLHAGDGEYRRTVELGVVQAVQQMDAAGSGRRQADAEPVGELGIAARHECRCLLVPGLHEADRLLPGAQ